METQDNLVRKKDYWYCQKLGVWVIEEEEGGGSSSIKMVANLNDNNNN